MALSKNKLKSNLREELEAKEDGKGKNNRSDDPRYLPYYKMEERETMKVVFVADPRGELYDSYAKHGSNINVQGVKTINCCYTSSGESCPVCQMGWEHYQADGKDSEMAKMLQKREHFITQCIPIETNLDIPDTVDEEGNLTTIVKLMALPFKVKEKIDEAIIGGEVDDPTELVFVIKKNKNKGGYATYENSYFLHKDLEEVVPQEIFEAVDAGLAEPYNLEDELPEPTTSEELQEWLDDALEKIAKANETKNRATNAKRVVENKSSGGDEDSSDEDDGKEEGNDEPEVPVKKQTSPASDSGISDAKPSSKLQEKLAQRRKS